MGGPLGAGATRVPLVLQVPYSNGNSFNFYKTRDGPNHDCSTINRFVAAAPKLSDDMCNMTVTVLSYRLNHVTVLFTLLGAGVQL